MAIDTSQIQWDDAPAPIDVKKVKWDDPVAETALSPSLTGSITPVALSNLSDMASATGHHISNFANGAAQFIENGASSLADKYIPGSSVAQVLKDNANNTNSVMAKWEKDYQKSVPNSPGAYAGATLGEVLPFIVSGGSSSGANLMSTIKKAGDAVGAVPTVLGSLARMPSIGAKLGGVASGATQGALASLAAPVTDADKPYWDQLGDHLGFGSLVGGALPILGGVKKGITGAWNALKPIVDPTSAAANLLYKNIPSGDVSSVIDNIRNAPSYVDGSVPTTAQVAKQPSFVMAEKIMRNDPNYKLKFEELAAANSAARKQVVSNIAGSQSDLDAAIQNRSDVTKPLYDAAKSEILPVDDELAQILARPSAKSAMQRGSKLAAERGEDVNMTPFQPVQVASSKILDASGKPIATDTPAQNGQVSGNFMHYLKMGIDDLQKEGKSNGIGSHEQNALSDTSDDLLNWYDKASPTYQNARNTYASMSTPINTMEAAQQLQEGLNNGHLNAAHDPMVTFDSYKNKLTKSLKDSKYGIDPASQAALEGVQNDLQRGTVSNSIKSQGSDTAFNMQAPNWLAKQLYGGSYGGDSALPKVAAGATLFGTGSPTMAGGAYLGAQKTGQFVGENVKGALAKMLLDKKMAADEIQKIIDKKGSSGALSKLRTNPAAAALIGNSPQFGGYISGVSGQ